MTGKGTTTSRILLASVAIGASAVGAQAGIVHVFEDQPLFDSLVGGATTIDFVAADGVPSYLPVDAYASLGLTLSSSPVTQFVNYIQENDPLWGWVDGWGLVLNSGVVAPPYLAFDFASPIHGFAAERLLDGGSSPTCKFYLGGQLVAQDTFPMPGVPSGTYFVGWVTDFQFDRVTFDYHEVDNIYFQTIPAPGGLALALVGIMTAGRRRR